MADIRKQYHDQLQTTDLLPHNDPQQAEAQQTVLNEIPDQQKFEDPNKEAQPR